MLGAKKLKNITDYVLKVSRAKETEVLLFVDDSSLTRFANNIIHQNVTSENMVIQIRGVIGKKIGVAVTNLGFKSGEFDSQMKKRLAEIAKEAFEIAKLSPEDPNFNHLPGLNEGKFHYEKVAGFKESTALVDPLKRAASVEKIITEAKKVNIKAFGSLSTGVGEVVVANSHGVFAYYPSTQAFLNIRMMSDKSSGYAGEINTDFNELNIETATKRAIDKTLQAEKLTEVEPGEYEVILEEPAVAEMMTYMSYLGFGARAFHEDRSFLSGKLGQKVLGENITIWDNGLSSKVMPMPFDYQGIPKRNINLIDKGVAKNILYDHYLAQKYHQKPTGHGFPAPNTEDAFASHLHLQSGNTPRKDLLKGMKRGILISRFWYVRNVHPKELTITGMTRDGTFLIENGEVVSGVRNMRFTISIPEILSKVTHISREVHLEPSDEGFGASLLPALRARDFTFTGVSKL